jgi:hypothetical protein
MLSAQTLNRVSHSYRRGYYAGYDGQPAQNDAVPTTENGIPLKAILRLRLRRGLQGWRERQALGRPLRGARYRLATPPLPHTPRPSAG